MHTQQSASPLALFIFHSHRPPSRYSFFFFNDTATTEIYTLSLHDALPISWSWVTKTLVTWISSCKRRSHSRRDRKSTRLNSSHGYISYAVFCLKKKKKQT